jgi:hypothetical protein
LGNFQRFEDFQEAICQVEWKSLFNKLQALASGNKYALHDIYGPGFLRSGVLARKFLHVLGDRLEQLDQPAHP